MNVRGARLARSMLPGKLKKAILALQSSDGCPLKIRLDRESVNSPRIGERHSPAQISWQSRTGVGDEQIQFFRDLVGIHACRCRAHASGSRRLRAGHAQSNIAGGATLDRPKA